MSQTSVLSCFHNLRRGSAFRDGLAQHAAVSVRMIKATMQMTRAGPLSHICDGARELDPALHRLAPAMPKANPIRSPSRRAMMAWPAISRVAMTAATAMKSAKKPIAFGPVKRSDIINELMKAEIEAAANAVMDPAMMVSLMKACIRRSTL